VGSSNSAQITVTNSGNTAASISNVSVSGAGMNPSGLTTGQVIGAGQSATMNVTFAPAGTGTVSGSVTISSNAANSPLTVNVSGSGAQAPVAHSATLVWSPGASTVVGYNVYSSATSGGTYTKLTASPITTTTFTDSSVQAGMTYYYAVTSINSSNMESTYSNIVSGLIP
jgi:fibronectin type 3 domain-containing protein